MIYDNKQWIADIDSVSVAFSEPNMLSRSNFLKASSS